MNSFPVLSASHDTNSSMVVLQSAQLPQILLLLLIGVAASLGAPPTALSSMEGLKTRCSFADHEYEVNQKWYKHIKTPKMTACILCICKNEMKGAAAHCSNVTCSRSMCEDSKRDECCDICNESSVDATKSRTPSTSTTRDNSKLPCLHNGQVYQHGEEFSSNSTGLQTQKPNQCIHCICQTGLVLCRLQTCAALNCFSSEAKDCCPTCKDEMLPSEQAIQPNPVLVTIMVSDSQQQSGDCVSSGVTYNHGSTWHPVIGPFGPMDCVFCKCQDRKIECSRLNCPPVQQLHCSKPIQVPGHCCPLCTGDDQRPSIILRKDITPVLQEPPISITIEHQPPKTKPPEQKVFDCLPPQTNTVVFRSHASSSSSAYYQYAFQSAAGDRSTRLLTWTVKDSRIGDFSEQHLSKEEFRALMGTFQFKVQGATRTKFMEKFIRKAKRLPDRCGEKCATKIQHLGQVLHLREIIRKQNCLPSETALH